MFSVSVFLFISLTIPSLAGGLQLGAPITDKTKDVLFRDMGQAYISNFGVVDTDANLPVVLEDTIGVDEFWVVDFQPYEQDPNQLPVDANTGDIKPDNTGSCSNVIINGAFQSPLLGPGSYFQDNSNFIALNMSLWGIGGNGDMVHKRLFEHYMRRDAYNTTDQYGDIVQRRDYVILFQDDFGFFFNCTDTDGNLIWRYSNTTDEIEFRTTLYVTNVRLRDRSDPDVFTVSARDPSQAWIKIEFETLIESPDGELLSYIDDTLGYTSRNNVASLQQVLTENDSSTGREGCVIIQGSRCRQTWTFFLVLDLLGDLPVDDMPIDATGGFSFAFEKHNCSDSTANSPSDCDLVPGVNFTISLSVTIQTFVSLVDEHLDESTIVLKSLVGANGEDLRGGAAEDRRGVNHLEAVTMVVGYEPEELHVDFDLLLTLFMVCKQNNTGLSVGCLDAETSNRYIAYYHNDFKYIHTPIEGEATTYELADIADEWNPSAEEGTQQTLTVNDFSSEDNQYTMGFVSTALSQERLTYTIITVYKLVYKTGRRRRDTSEDKQILVISNLHPYGETRTRVRRDLTQAAQYPQGHTVMLDFNGCPPRSTFNPDTLDCDCPAGEFYDTEVFECYRPTGIFSEEPATYKPDTDVEEKSDDGVVTKEKSAAKPLSICFTLHFIVLFLVYCFTY